MMTQDISSQDIGAPEDNALVKDVVDEVAGYVEDYKDRERTPWQKLFPTRQQRQIEMAKYKTVKERYNYQIQAVQIAHQAQLQAIQEMYNDFLIKGKAKIRKDRSEFFQQQYEQLMRTLSQKSLDFTAQMDASYQQLASVKVDKLRDRQEALIDTIAESYYATVGKLIYNFQRILDEEIHSPGMPGPGSMPND